MNRHIMKLSTLALLSAVWPADVLTHPVHQFKRPLPISTTKTGFHITPRIPDFVLEPHSFTYTDASSAFVTRASDALATTNTESFHLAPRKANFISLSLVFAAIAWLVWHFKLKEYTDVAQIDLSTDLSSAAPATITAEEFPSLVTEPALVVIETDNENKLGKRGEGEPKGFNDWFWTRIGAAGKWLPGGNSKKK